MELPHIAQLKEKILHPPIRWMDLAGIRGEIVAPRHVKMVMPVAGTHVNHVGTAYAGSIFALAEMTGGALIQSAYGFDRFVPIVKGGQIRYLKPTSKDLVCQLSLTEAEAEAKLTPIRERGRGDYLLTVPVHDADGVEVAVAEMNYYLIPAPAPN